MIGYEINIFINVVCSVIANLICTPHAIKPKLEVYGGIEIMKKIAALDMLIEESCIPHRVDWVLFDEADQTFRAVAEKDAVVWKG